MAFCLVPRVDLCRGFLLRPTNGTFLKIHSGTFDVFDRVLCNVCILFAASFLLCFCSFVCICLCRVLFAFCCWPPNFVRNMTFSIKNPNLTCLCFLLFVHSETNNFIENFRKQTCNYIANVSWPETRGPKGSTTNKYSRADVVCTT